MNEFKKLQILNSITGPGFVDLMEYFSPEESDEERPGIIFVGYDAKTRGVEGMFHLVCAIPEREKHYADLIPRAVNSYEALHEALKLAHLHLSVYAGTLTGAEEAAELGADMETIVAALRLAEGGDQ